MKRIYRVILQIFYLIIHLFHSQEVNLDLFINEKFLESNPKCCKFLLVLIQYSLLFLKFQISRLLDHIIFLHSYIKNRRRNKEGGGDSKIPRFSSSIILHSTVDIFLLLFIYLLLFFIFSISKRFIPFEIPLIPPPLSR